MKIIKHILHNLNFKLIVLFLIFNLKFVICNCFAQNAKADSLLTLLKTTKEDTTKVNTLNNLFLQYEFSDDEKAKGYLDKALELSANGRIDFKKGLTTTYTYLGYFAEDKGNYPEALKNYFASLKIKQAIGVDHPDDFGNKKGIANSYNNIGNVYYNQGNYPEALKNQLTALKIKEAMEDKAGIAGSYNNIGLVYRAQGNYPESLKNYFASLKIREAIEVEHPDDFGNKEGIASSYNNIGNIYYAQAELEQSPELRGSKLNQALKNHFASLKIRKAMSDKKGIAASYVNIGLVYHAQAELKQSPELRVSKLDQALKNYFASLKIREAIGDKAGIAASYNNIGGVYYAQAELEQNPELRGIKLNQALKNHFASLKIKKAIGDKAGVASSYANIGDAVIKMAKNQSTLKLRQAKYKEAEEYLIKAKELSKEIGYKECLRATYSGLTELDSAKGNYKGAYENHKLYILYRDSLDNEKTRKKTIQSQMTFDFEKKEAVADAEHKKELENQKALAEEKSRKQKIVLFLVLGSLFLVLIFAGFIFRSLRTTRKQKNIIEEQKKMVEEKQKEIIDSITYARRIQRALLPTEKYIDKNLKRFRKY